MRVCRSFQGRLQSRCARILTYPALVEEVLDPAIELPSSKPASPQWTKTPSASDLVSVDKAVRYIESLPYILLWGYNTGGAAVTLYWEYKNGTTVVSSGSQSVPAYNYWTLNFLGGDAIVASQDLTVTIWGSTTALSYRGQAFIVLSSKLRPMGRDNAAQPYYYDCRINTVAGPTISVGNPYGVSNEYLNISLEYGTGLNWYGCAIGTGTYDMNCLKETAEYGMGVSYMWPNHSCRVGTTYYPRYFVTNKMYSFRGTPIRGITEGKYVK